MEWEHQQPDVTEKPLHLDKMITMSVMPPVTPQMGQKKTPAEKTLPDSEKKKKAKKKKSKGGEVAGLSASTEKKMGLKETALRQVLNVAFGSLDEPAPPGVQAEAISLQEARPGEGEWMEEMSEVIPPRESRGMTPVADFAKLTVSVGTPEWQEVSTPPVLPPVPEQAGPQDVEMAVPGPNTIVLEEEEAEVALEEPTFGVPRRRLTPAEEVELKKYQAQWDVQDRMEIRRIEKIACETKAYEALLQAE